MASPVEQFAIVPLVGGHSALAITNATVWMVIVAVVATSLLMLGMRGRALVPTRMQSAAEMFYEIIAHMIRENVGAGGRKYFPYIFTLFMFVLFCNLLGLIPGSLAVTSQLIVTFTMAAVIFVAVTIIGFATHGFRYFRMFFPHGAPLWTAVVLVPVELISYLSRPVSLSLRLFANMTVGHVLLKVIAGFVPVLGIFGVLPFLALVPLTLLELLIAVLQAYIFTILSCVYLNDALHLH